MYIRLYTVFDQVQLFVIVESESKILYRNLLRIVIFLNSCKVGMTVMRVHGYDPLNTVNKSQNDGSESETGSKVRLMTAISRLKLE